MIRHDSADKRASDDTGDDPGDNTGNDTSDIDRAGLSRRIARDAATLLPAAVVQGALHVISTPIGHLADITLRALAVLQQAAAVCCEDTRHARTLLSRYGIDTPTVALHEHNEAQATPLVLARLQAGDAIALISDAGTPLVSDPGARLVDAVIAAGLRVVPIPGPSATLAALVASGLAAQPSTFFGFLPRKGAERRDAVDAVCRSPFTSVLFEAPPRLADTLRELAQAAGHDRAAAVCRELTKHFEEVRRGTLTELAAYYGNTPPRGEIVIVIGGSPAVTVTEESLRSVSQALRAEGRRPRDIIHELVDAHGASRNLAYRLAHES